MDYILKDSCENNKPIIIIYDSNGEISKRSIIVKEIGDDYVMAYCNLRRAKRKFKLDNILSIGYPDDIEQ